MDISAFIAFLFILINLIESLYDKSETWKVIIRIIALIITIVPVLTGLYDFFTSAKSKKLRILYSIIKLIIPDSFETWLSGESQKDRGIYCNEFTNKTTSCFHARNLIFSKEGNLNFREKYCNSNFLYLFVNKSDYDSNINLYKQYSLFETTFNYSENGEVHLISNDDLNVLSFCGTYNKDYILRGNFPLSTKSLFFIYDSKTKVVYFKLKDSRCDYNMIFNCYNVNYTNIEYMYYFLNYLNSSDRFCCFVNDLNRKIEGKDNIKLHCFPIKTVLKFILEEGKRISFDRHCDKLKIIEDENLEGLYFKYGVKASIILKEIVLEFYKDYKIDEIFYFLKNKETGKGYDYKRMQIGNWQFKRFLVNISYFRELIGMPALLGSDQSINPKVNFIKWVKERIKGETFEDLGLIQKRAAYSLPILDNKFNINENVSNLNLENVNKNVVNNLNSKRKIFENNLESYLFKKYANIKPLNDHRKTEFVSITKTNFFNNQPEDLKTFKEALKTNKNNLKNCNINPGNFKEKRDQLKLQILNYNLGIKSKMVPEETDLINNKKRIGIFLKKELNKWEKPKKYVKKETIKKMVEVDNYILNENNLLKINSFFTLIVKKEKSESEIDDITYLKDKTKKFNEKVLKKEKEKKNRGRKKRKKQVEVKIQKLNKLPMDLKLIQINDLINKLKAKMKIRSIYKNLYFKIKNSSSGDNDQDSEILNKILELKNNAKYMKKEEGAVVNKVEKMNNFFAKYIELNKEEVSKINDKITKIEEGRKVDMEKRREEKMEIRRKYEQDLANEKKRREEIEQSKGKKIEGRIVGSSKTPETKEQELERKRIEKMAYKREKNKLKDMDLQFYDY